MDRTAVWRLAVGLRPVRNWYARLGLLMSSSSRHLGCHRGMDRVAPLISSMTPFNEESNPVKHSAGHELNPVRVSSDRDVDELRSAGGHARSLPALPTRTELPPPREARHGDDRDRAG